YADIAKGEHLGRSESESTLKDDSPARHEPQSSVTTLASTAVGSPTYARSFVASPDDDDDDADFEYFKAPNGAKLTSIRMGPEYLEHSMRSARETRDRMRRRQHPRTHRAFSF